MDEDKWSADEDKSGGRRGQEGSGGHGAAPSSSSLVCVMSESWMREGPALKATSRPAGTQIGQHMNMQHEEGTERYQRGKGISCKSQKKNQQENPTNIEENLKPGSLLAERRA